MRLNNRKYLKGNFIPRKMKNTVVLVEHYGRNKRRRIVGMFYKDVEKGIGKIV